VTDRFQHFLLTNFNVPRMDCRLDADGAPVDRHGTPVRTVEWLEHRFALFERFCLPSVLGQTNQNFTWYIRYDDTAPGECGRRLSRYRAVRNLRLVSYPHAFSQTIEDDLAANTECVISTRLDNDDALHRDTVAEIQRQCRPGTTELLHFPLGYVYDVVTGAVRLRRYDTSPFLSFVEHPRRAPIRSALHIDHTRAAEVAPVRHICEGEPRWLVVVHERNMSNALRGSACQAGGLDAEFNIGAAGERLVRPLLMSA
jgi:hypothetical protein